MATFFETTSLSGYVYVTTFGFKLLSAYDYSLWNFGDGTSSYNKQTVEHIYNYPGTYQISVTAGFFEQEIHITDQVQISAFLAVKDGVLFTQVPSNYGIAGKENFEPFVISLTSSRIDQPISVCLHSVNSQSVPYQQLPDTKWNFLIPKWKFINSTTNEIFGESILLSTTPIYLNSKVAGVSGQLSFYYIDDSSTNVNTPSAQPITLIATLCTENFAYYPESIYTNYKSYSNPKNTSASIQWHLSAAQITNYKVTENYLNDIYPFKWVNVPIPVMITCLHQLPDQTFIDVLEYPKTNNIGLSNPLTITLLQNGTPVATNFYKTEKAQYAFQAFDSKNRRNSGYIFTTLTVLSSLSGSLQIKANSTNPLISGVSNEFKVTSIENYKIAKVNETFDYSKYLKSLALPEILSNNTEFFDQFLKAIVGDSNPENESIGRVVYERIANFLQNHADVDTAEVDQLLSMASELSVDADNYQFSFPEEIKRLVNLFSIAKHHLRGMLDYGSDIESKIKKHLTETSQITAGQTLIIKDILYGNYNFVVVSPFNNLNVYPLSSIELAQARMPIMTNYLFFEYEETAIGYKNNIIDWDSNYNTISYNLSTQDEWYGDDGIVDIMFNNLLTKRLFLS